MGKAVRSISKRVKKVARGGRRIIGGAMRAKRGIFKRALGRGGLASRILKKRGGIKRKSGGMLARRKPSGGKRTGLMGKLRKKAMGARRGAAGGKRRKTLGERKFDAMRNQLNRRRMGGPARPRPGMGKRARRMGGAMARRMGGAMGRPMTPMRRPGMGKRRPMTPMRPPMQPPGYAGGMARPQMPQQAAPVANPALNRPVQDATQQRSPAVPAQPAANVPTAQPQAAPQVNLLKPQQRRRRLF